MDSSVDVSVIMPVHNGAAFVRTAMRGIETLAPRPSEVIVVLDGCTDRTESIVRSFQAAIPGLIVVVLEDRRGPGVARNIGVSHATSGFVWFCDADDQWASSIVGDLYAAASAAGAELAICRARVSTQRGVIVRHAPQLDLRHVSDRVISGRHALAHMLENEISGHLWNKLFQTDGLRQHPFPGRATNEDLWLCLQAAAEADRVAIVDDTLYTYERRPGSVVNSGNNYARGFGAVRDVLADRIAPRKSVSQRQLLAFEYRWVAIPVVKSCALHGPRDDEEREVLRWSQKQFTWTNIGAAVLDRKPGAALFGLAAKLRIAPHGYRVYYRLRYNSLPFGNARQASESWPDSDRGD